MFHKWRPPLSECRLFDGISWDELAGILQCLGAKTNEYRKNACVVIAGDSLEGIGIVLAGVVAVTKETMAGDRIIMVILGPGEVFGEVAAYAEGGVWQATVMAQEDCVLLFLPPRKIIGQCGRQCSSHRLLLMNMLKIISNRALFLNKKIEYLSKKSLRGKIAAFLLEEYQNTNRNTFRLPFNRNELADFLNVSRPGLSREMGRMRDEGLLEFHKESVKLKDINALKQMAE
jgi:CRP-like cAMP-binding protein